MCAQYSTSSRLPDQPSAARCESSSCCTHVWDCSAGLGTPIAWCGRQQKGDSPEFGHSGFFQATRVLQVLPSAYREEQEALGKDDLLV